MFKRLAPIRWVLNFELRVTGTVLDTRYPELLGADLFHMNGAALFLRRPDAFQRDFQNPVPV